MLPCGNKIGKLSAIPDHVHAVVSIPPPMSVLKQLQLLKGGSSNKLVRRKPAFRGRYLKSHFWILGKFYSGVGDDNAETVFSLC